MSKEITWEELLKERYSEKSEKKKENTENICYCSRAVFKQNVH